MNVSPKLRSGATFQVADVIAMRPLLENRPRAKRFVEGISGAAISENLFRQKHAFEYTNANGEHVCFLNARQDFLTNERRGSIGHLLKINTGNGNVTKVFHNDIIELRPFSPAVESRPFSGAEDPRYFWRGGQLGVIFNAACHDGNRRMFIYFEHLNHCIKLKIPGFPLRKIEKNWTAMVVENIIYIIYSFSPTIVFRLVDEKTGLCSLATALPFAQSFPIEPSYPYGGSSLCLWQWPYYIGLVHARSPARPAFIAFNADQMCVGAVGESFTVPEPAEATYWHGKDVEYPYHLNFGDGDAAFWVECQDCPTRYDLDVARFRNMVDSLISEVPSRA